MALVVAALLFACAARANGPVSFSIQPVRGPAPVTLADGLAGLEVPAGYMFLAREDAIRVLKRAGNPVDGSEVGLVHPMSSARKAFVVIERAQVGHVPDEERLEPEPLLAGISAGQAHQNEGRRARGLEEITVLGWAVPPIYDRGAHRASWAVLAKSGKEELVNSRTRLLGRDGYLSFNLVTTPADFPKDRELVEQLLTTCSFSAGQRYEDFQPGKDRAAAGGLSDLVIGVSHGAEGWSFTHWRDPLIAVLKVVAAVCALVVLIFGRFRKRRVVRAPIDPVGPAPET